MYISYESHFINAKSIRSYLSGIVNSLEGLYPDVRTHRNAVIVRNTLSGCIKMSSHVVSRKAPLTRADIGRIIELYYDGSYDDLLFIAVLATGFCGLNRLGKLVWPDSRNPQEYRKVIDATSLRFSDDHYSFFLPGHKGNRFFAGNTVLITRRDDEADPLPVVRRYLDSRMSLPLTRVHTALFVREDATIPTRSWFLSYLATHLLRDFAGHSIRSGGATDLALRGVPDHLIQKIGRWSSDAFQFYIRTNPALLAALTGIATAVAPP